MSSTQAFIEGAPVIVVARGPGKIHLLSYGSNGGIPNHVGSITATATSEDGVTRFLISHSYTFTGFAFYWDGAGEAVWYVGNQLARQPVGNSWSHASSQPWGGKAVTSVNVSGEASKAVSRDNQVTCFIIPSMT